MKVPESDRQPVTLAIRLAGFKNTCEEDGLEVILELDKDECVYVIRVESRGRAFWRIAIRRISDQKLVDTVLCASRSSMEPYRIDLDGETEGFLLEVC